MNKYLFFLILLIPCININAQGFDVIKFTAEYNLHENGKFDVTEKYKVNFVAYKHGIYRTLPTYFTFTDSLGKTFRTWLDISNIEVSNHPFSVNNIFSKRINKSLRIKIGDINKTVIGPKFYKIKYSVDNGLMFDQHQDYFYWNIKTTEWKAEFKDIEFSIHLPKNIPDDSVSCYVYSGTTGNSQLSNTFDYQFTDGVLTGKLKKGEVSTSKDNLTVLIKFPKGYFPETNPWISFLKNNLWIPIILILFLSFFILWYVYGKDRKVISGIQYYPPKGVNPALAGYLINDKLSHNDILTLLPYFGANGHISIKEIKDLENQKQPDLLIKKLKPLPKDAKNYEKTFFDGLFRDHSKQVKMSQLKNKFYPFLLKTKSYLLKEGMAYYNQKSENIKWKLGIWMVIFFLAAIIFTFIWWGGLAGLCMFGTAVVLFILNRYMSKKNKKGDAVYSELKGFKMFISTAEQHRLKMLLEKDPYYFEKTMPYAMAFGLLDKWAERFSSLKFESPTWYSSVPGVAFTAATFTHQFSGSMNTFQSVAVSSPATSSSGGSGFSGGGFSGGGFSGGGGGGGGGGSW